MAIIKMHWFRPMKKVKLKCSLSTPRLRLSGSSHEQIIQRPLTIECTVKNANRFIRKPFCLQVSSDVPGSFLQHEITATSWRSQTMGMVQIEPRPLLWSFGIWCKEGCALFAPKPAVSVLGCAVGLEGSFPRKVHEPQQRTCSRASNRVEHIHWTTSVCLENMEKIQLQLQHL